MSTLAEIEEAADTLSSEDKDELLRFLAMRLRQDRAAADSSAQTDLTRFAGILHLTEDPLEWQRRAREEWE